MKKVSFFPLGMLCFCVLLAGCTASQEGETEELLTGGALTPTLSEAEICPEVADNKCVAPQEIFRVDAPEIAASVLLQNAPVETRVHFDWQYLDGERSKQIGSMYAVAQKSSGYLKTVLENIREEGWRTGEYKVIIKIDGQETDPIIKTFYVE